MYAILYSWIHSYKTLKSILSLARKQTYQAINSQMVKAYWLVGQRIVEEEQEGKEKAVYGDKLLENLSKALSAELGKGFSLANLKNFRKFYLTYPDFEKSYALRSQLTWTHHRLIMRVEDEPARRYYVEACKKEQWSTRTLERHIQTRHFERLLSTQKPETSTKARTEKHDFIKDPYVFEFLKIPQAEHESEQTTEGLIITDLQKFMLELGKGFAFVGR